MVASYATTISAAAPMEILNVTMQQKMRSNRQTTVNSTKTINNKKITIPVFELANRIRIPNFVTSPNLNI